MTRANTIRFDDLPTFEGTPTFFSLPENVGLRLRHLPNVYAKASTALRFTSYVGADPRVLHLRDEERPWMSAACLRAALMDFVGMEETLRGDLRARGFTENPRTIKDTQNAMLILMRELRNVHVHSVVPLHKETRTAYIPANPDLHIIVDAHILPPGELQRLRGSRNAKHFEADAFAQAIEWLDDAQKHWGIEDVVLRAIWKYADEIVTSHPRACAA